MRVLMLSRFRYRRMINHIFSLATELSRQNTEVMVVIIDCPAAYYDSLRRYNQHFPCFAESHPEKILGLARYFHPDLLHLHDLALANITQRLLRLWPIPCGITLHDRMASLDQLSPFPLSFLISPYPITKKVPSWLRQRIFFIPEGIDLQAYQPQKKEGFKVALILEIDSFTAEGSAALLKAAALADLEVELICPQPLPLLKGRFHGWPLDCSAVLAKTQITVGSRRGLLEGMASGNATLLMDQNYGGLFNPQKYPAPLLFPDLSTRGNEPPCYRSIFFDLSTLLKDHLFLESLQEQGRKFVRENCDLRLIAEQTSLLYSQIA